MSKVSTTVITGDLSMLEAARSSWVEQATLEERATLKRILQAHDTKTIPGINAMVGDIVVEILTGGMSPALATAAKPWVEFMAANVWAMDMKAGVPEQAGLDVAAMIADLKARVVPVQAKYQITESSQLPDVLDAEVEEQVVRVRTAG